MTVISSHLLMHSSADIEMTVNMLIQIDKLVQLLESPVFTCELPELACPLHLRSQLHLF